jgi:hypothetical protein
MRPKIESVLPVMAAVRIAWLRSTMRRRYCIVGRHHRREVSSWASRHRSRSDAAIRPKGSD